MQCSAGHENADGLRYCGECGVSLDSLRASMNEPAAPPSVQQPQAQGGPDVPLSEAQTAASETLSSRARTLAKAALALTVLLLCLVVVVLKGGSESHTIRGIFSLVGEPGDVYGTWNNCSGVGGYSDFGARQAVVVTDAEGTVIGSTSTVNLNRDLVESLVDFEPVREDFDIESEASGAAVKEMVDVMLEGTDAGLYCAVYYEVEVPTADFYTIEIGSRGDISYSFDQLAERQFYVTTALG